MEMREVPTCPKCGAEAAGAVVGQRHRCVFCGAVSVLEAPVLLRQVVVQAEVIRRVVMVEPISGRTTLPCPRCDAPLFEGTVADATLHGCGTCGGVWLDNDASGRLVRGDAPKIVGLAQQAAHARKAPVDERRSARCPLDRTELQRTTIHAVDVDVCPAHGTWFDAGEVQAMAAAFKRARVAAIPAGPTYDYAAAAEATSGNREYAEGAITVLGAVLEVAGAFFS